MSILRLRRQTEAALARLLEQHRADTLTYEPGLTAREGVPSGFRRDAWSAPAGEGDAAFAAARDVVRAWGIQRGSGLIVAATSDVTLGARVAFAAPLPIAGHVVGMCEVVDVVDAPDRYAFAYGTLPLHPERGEERFEVRLGADRFVTLAIDVVWQPHHALARVAPVSLTRWLQQQATMRYLEVLRPDA